MLWKDHRLSYTLAGGGRFDFTVGPLPPPLHLLPAVFSNDFFDWHEKARLARVLVPILFGSDAYKVRQNLLTYQEWHRRNGIGELMLRKMFLPMALALKFVPPEQISAKIVLDVMGIFLREPAASRMGFLDGSPQERLIGPLADYLTARGAVIRTGQKVRRVLLGEERRVDGLVLENGEIARADSYLLALPVHQLNRVVAPEIGGFYPFPDLAQFEGVPVITVQLWLDRPVTFIDDFLFCPDGRIPVYADLGNTTPGYANVGRSRMQFVVAPAADLIDQDDRAIVERVWADFVACFPDTAPAARILKSSVVRIPKAVHWPMPGIDVLRPSRRTGRANLYLAGGYTRQDFYDSMEGAVASGRPRRCWRMRFGPHRCSRRRATDGV